MKAIEATNLSKTFRGKKGHVVEALKNLSFEIETGEVFGFLGPNGAGKSTTIKILMGLISSQSGEAKIMGHRITSSDARKYVGYLPENPSFYDYLTAEEYLAFVGENFKMTSSQVKESSDAVLELLELTDARKRSVRSYSKGMVQRLGIAQVLLHDPDVYILDEPMSGLDPLGRVLVKNIILDLKRRGKSVFFSTHITSDVETICDRVGIIAQGSLKSVEQVQSVLTKGVTGYRVRLSEKRDGAHFEDAYISKDKIVQFLADKARSGAEISLIEPERKNLEQFFLDIVQDK